MITRLSNMIADFFIRRKVIESEERDIYIYGCEALFSAISNLVILFVCGIMTGEIVSAFLFLFIFVLMRKYCGGYHAQTHLQCNFVFALTTLAILLIVKNNFLMDSFVFIITLITSDIIIFWLAPIVNVNKPLEDFEIIRFRKAAITLTIIFTIIAVLLIYIYKAVSIIIALTLLAVSIAMLYAKLFTKGDAKK